MPFAQQRKVDVFVTLTAYNAILDGLLSAETSDRCGGTVLHFALCDWQVELILPSMLVCASNADICLDQVFDPELEEEVSYSKVLEQQRSNDQSEAALHEIELGAIDSVGTWCA